MWFINLIKMVLGFLNPSPNDPSNSGNPTPDQPAPITTPPTTPDTEYLNNSLFNEALTLVLKYEGGYVNNPADHGGATNKGIIQREYDRYRQANNQDLQSVQFILDEEVKDIYYKNYWYAGKCYLLPPGIAIIHFDSCVNCGTAQSAKFLQRAASVPDDGIVGAITIAAINKLLVDNKETYVLHSYLEQRANFYYKLVEKDPSQKVFIKGWQNRISDLTAYIDKRGTDPIPV